eukprot:CAMPEP_0194483656 /NCGR_PEP_ID=MMETSP0253-20130528/5193_1 /TAXON_ID=2966 /ORGANISM="Noctiluca scintillans" /LENGTH=219 /DNA_ID=CAMNT_0039323335 /DNA_START=97 /DNA_END=756 /DNA_ORIENTATION=+
MALLCRLPSFKYFFGWASIMLFSSLVLWFAMMTMVLSREWVERQMAVMLLLILPVVVLLLTLEGLQMRFQSLLLALSSNDCVTFKDKFDIEMSWWYAHDLLVNCSTHRALLSHAAVEDLYTVTPIETCPGYADMLPEHGGRWQFLSEMEAKYHCGGWCSPEAPVWGTSNVMQDSCSRVAGTALSSVVLSSVVKVVVYLVALLMFFFGMLTYFPESVLMG